MAIECPSSSAACADAAKSSGVQSPFTHLIDKLDSLATFYQQQLDWVDKTTRLEAEVVDMEDSDDEHQPSEPTPALRPAGKSLTSAELRRMHWRRQMRSLESKLNGKAQKHRQKSVCRRPVRVDASRRKDDEDAGSQYILTVFGQMMGARMESCRRVQKLLAVTGKSSGKFGVGRITEPSCT
ncbi:hypothetical protein DFH07DRAFT_955833 [Mycena maculata]|uniref:Uncharacterized protein n=1 Tax=Mycena maculata TaxID=230809 RepID=A0AAD7JKZ8_9AGAR|nr:hypothetical protein DFH07DRAFT_955833 [Mycena maculata]